MKRSKHNLSHYKLLTGDMGKLIPVTWYEALPGDTIQQQTSALIRLSPQVAPVMHPVQVRFHTFFVPNRILDPNWENFITGGDGFTEYEHPTIVPSTGTSSLADYMGVGANSQDIPVNAFPFLAYAKIWNEFYRDQDLQEEMDPTNPFLQFISWGKDYFTTARPWTQKGETVTLPVGGQAPIRGLGAAGGVWNETDRSAIETGGVDTTYALAKSSIGDGINQEMLMRGGQDGYPDVYADLGAAEQISVNDFRKGFALQRYAEARARYGSRYTEYLRYCGVSPRDSRLQRPEYLGGGKQTISFSEVLQTASDDIGQEQTPVGTLRGHGIAGSRTNRWRKYFEEHGIVMTLMSVRPKSIYNDSLHRSFLRSTKEDYFQKELQHIGQQEVYNNEVYGDPTDGMETFGYSDRYREYRELPSTVSGEFRNTLDHWHLARKFEEPPVLNEDFIRCNPSKRIFAEQTTNPLWCMVNHSIQARRQVSKSAGGKVI